MLLSSSMTAPAAFWWIHAAPRWNFGRSVDARIFSFLRATPSPGSFLVRRGHFQRIPRDAAGILHSRGDRLFVLGTLRENPGLESAADCLAAGVGQEASGIS